MYFYVHYEVQWVYVKYFEKIEKKCVDEILAFLILHEIATETQKWSIDIIWTDKSNSNNNNMVRKYFMDNVVGVWSMERFCVNSYTKHCFDLSPSPYFRPQSISFAIYFIILILILFLMEVPAWADRAHSSHNKQ